MPVTYINDDEFEAMYQLRPEEIAAYLYIKRYADRGGVCGQKRKISYLSISEFLETPTTSGRAGVKPTKKAVRCIVSRLEKTGLLKQITAEKSLVFCLNFAVADDSVQKRWGTGGAQVGHTTQGTGGAHLKASNSNKNDEPETEGAACGKMTHPHEEGHTSPVTSHLKDKRQKPLSSLTTENSAEPSDPCRFIFNHWQQVMGHPRARLDDKRSKLIRRWLKLGYAASDLTAAIDGCKASDWHMGRNDKGQVYDALSLILRDADQIDKFIRINESGGARAGRQALLSRANHEVARQFKASRNVINMKGVQA